MSSAENPPDPDKNPAAAPEAGEQLPVYLDDDAVDSMTGETMDTGRGNDSDDDTTRPLVSDVRSGKAEKGRRKGGIGWFTALFLFLFAQFMLLLILGTVFRKPLSQAYDRLVARGYIEPGSLPWQSGGKTRSEADSAVGDVDWEDVRLRHELTLLADAAIARGERGAVEELRGMLDVTDDPVRRAAARAEIFRVQQMYATASRLPSDPLDVAQLFPGKSQEADLTEEQIVSLLTDPNREPEMKMRAAWMLKGHRTMTANDQLMLVIRNEQNLDVVKEAMLSFQSNTGYRSGDWFDANSAETWWAKNASRLAKEFTEDEAGEKPAAPEVAPDAEPADFKATTDPPAAPAPSADGRPEMKNLRPLPNVPSGGEATLPAAPATPDPGGN